ncbi:hypothetical protein JTE90_014133, partial [Oedothorax gibbosus]
APGKQKAFDRARVEPESPLACRNKGRRQSGRRIRPTTGKPKSGSVCDGPLFYSTLSEVCRKSRKAEKRLGCAH